jgi:formylmethanofuran dehydrogenase subunit E
MGNLSIKDYGKNAHTVFSRSRRQAYRFSRKTSYIYEGEDKIELAGWIWQCSPELHRMMKKTQPNENQ